jgi:hypothetical protein
VVEDDFLSLASVQSISKIKVLFETIKLYRVECTVNPLNSLAANALGGSQQQSAWTGSIKLWVPTSIMDCALPDMAQKYAEHSKTARKITVQPYLHSVCFSSAHSDHITDKYQILHPVQIAATEIIDLTEGEASGSGVPMNHQNLAEGDDSIIELTSSDSIIELTSADDQN